MTVWALRIKLDAQLTQILQTNTHLARLIIPIYKCFSCKWLYSQHIPVSDYLNWLIMQNWSCQIDNTGFITHTQHSDPVIPHNKLTESPGNQCRCFWCWPAPLVQSDPRSKRFLQQGSPEQQQSDLSVLPEPAPQLEVQQKLWGEERRKFVSREETVKLFRKRLKQPSGRSSYCLCVTWGVRIFISKGIFCVAASVSSLAFIGICFLLSHVCLSSSDSPSLSHFADCFSRLSHSIHQSDSPSHLAAIKLMWPPSELQAMRKEEIHIP